MLVTKRFDKPDKLTGLCEKSERIVLFRLTVSTLTKEILSKNPKLRSCPMSHF